MKRSSRGEQVKVYLGKCFRLFKNDKGYKAFIGAAVIAVIISGVVGSDMFVYFTPTQSGVFALVCAGIWIGVFNSIQSICGERQIIKREYRTGLHISSYVVARMIFEFVICVIEAIIVTAIFFIISGGSSTSVFMGTFLEILITMFLVIYSADVLGLAVSAIVKNETSAMTMMPFILILQLVMSGVIFQPEGVFDVIANFTISRWGVNAICSIVDATSLQGGAWIADRQPSLLSDYEHSLSNLMNSWLIMCVFILLYGMICIIALKFVDRDKR